MTNDEFLEIISGDHEYFTPYSSIEIESHSRWHVHKSQIFALRDSEELFEACWSDPATELQNRSGCTWSLTKVKERQVTTYLYEPIGEALYEGTL